MGDAPFDPRSVANSLLEVAWRYDVPVTHLSLQKAVYFLHAEFLKEYGEPLCQGYFEAWQHGPVHPQIWSSFKEAGRDAIRHTAYGIDILSGIPKKVEEISSTPILRFIAARGLPLLSIPAHRLVGMSHLPGGPWDRITKKSGGQREYGARISNELIVEAHHARMAPVRDSLAGDEDLYEQPPS